MNSSSNSNTFNVPEKLDVSEIFIPDIPDDIIFPNELNDFLREQIRYQVHENGMLQKKILDLEGDYGASRTKISELEVKLSNYEKLCNKNEFVLSSQVASTKIVELSKKLREKNSEVESLKTRCSKLEKHIFDLKQAGLGNDDRSGTSGPPGPVIEEKPVNELEEQLKKLSEKLTSVNGKLAESKNYNLQLKNELKLANKWLQQEIGESFEKLQSLNTSTGWRGRSQVICDLQQKNNELKDKLKAAQEKAKSTSTSEPNLSINKFESKVSILSMENTDLRTKYEDIKKRNDALRARFKVLDSEHAMMKSKVAMMKEQSDRDQDIISTLSAMNVQSSSFYHNIVFQSSSKQSGWAPMTQQQALGTELQIASSKNSINETLHQKERTINKIYNEKKQLLSEIEEYKNVIKNMQEELSKKLEHNYRIKNLPRLNKSENTENCEVLGLSEADKLSLLELVEQQNNRLKAEREDHAKTQALLRVEKQRAAKAEASAARLELGSNTCRSGYSSNISSSKQSIDSSLRDQLELAEENIKAMKTRLDIEQFERRSDLQEFSKILRGYTNNKD